MPYNDDRINQPYGDETHVPDFDDPGYGNQQPESPEPSGQPVRRDQEWPDPSPKRSGDEMPDDPRVPIIGDPIADPTDVPRTDQNPDSDQGRTNQDVPGQNPTNPNYPNPGSEQSDRPGY